MKKILLSLLLLSGCANLERGDEAVEVPADADQTPVVPADEHPITPPDAPPEDPPPPPDGNVPPPELDDETKAACCHALLDGAPPKHECGYPPGLCNNGKKVMFCTNDAGEDTQFELCNP